MSDVFFLLLRRLRAPLIVLTLVYAIATFVLTLIPGQTVEGETWYLSYFHAFYFISFTGSTIGFGEIPHAFSDAQRSWVLICMYASVIAWLYAIGNLLRLVQDKTFQQALSEKSFQRRISRLEQDFAIICGFGETGAMINQGLINLGIQAVIIDHDEARTNILELESLRHTAIVLTADATEPQSLLQAGLHKANCLAIVAVTGDDHCNLQIAVNSKLLNARLPVISSSQIEDEAANMASFGTETIIDPYKILGKRLDLLLRNPKLHQLHSWFIDQHIGELISNRQIPRGRWIVCGYGRIAKELEKQLPADDVELVFIDPDPILNHAPADTIVGRGTEAETLHEAGIESAVLIVAASDDEANNLSILITAQQINSQIYTVGIVNRRASETLFKKLSCDYIVRCSQIVANEVLTALSRPLVSRFIHHSNRLDQQQAEQLIERINTLTTGNDPTTWRLQLHAEKAPALFDYLRQGNKLTIGQACKQQHLPEANCLPLLLERNGISRLLPNDNEPLMLNDELLVCGSPKLLVWPQKFSHNSELIDSLLNQNPHHIPLLRWIYKKHEHKPTRLSD